MLADLRLYDLGDALLAAVPAAEAPALAARWNDLIFTEDLQITDVTAAIAQLLVIGENAGRTLAAATGLEATALRRLTPFEHRAAGDVVVARSDDVREPAFDVFVPRTMRQALIASLTRDGAAEASATLVEALRIDAGRPQFGVDMTTDTIPLEAGLLDRAISTTKGCYVGQELIIRILHRGGGRVARRLVQIVVDDERAETPPAGTDILVDGAAAGRVTSAAVSPRLGRPIALGYVPRAAAEPGTRISLASGGHSLPATITGLAG
jgi:folate-binding protein YgfZ